MSSKQHQEALISSDHKWVAKGKKLKEPNWDAFVRALVAYAVNEAESSEEADG